MASEDRKNEAPLANKPTASDGNKADILASENVDPVLNAKMRLINDAIDDIGFTPYHAKLFCLNGFGYATDSLLLLVQSIIAEDAAKEFHPSYPKGLTIAVYVGMLVGALFWGISADIIGRRFAFNFSLIISSIFALLAGSSPNWEVLGLWVCLSAFGSGGNLVLDTTVFLEYLPSKYQWLLTLMASWWGVGQLVAGLFAWAFLPNYDCGTKVPCTKQNNMGWRYVWLANGSLVLVMSLLRITVIRLKETPKFLVGEGRDEQLVDVLQGIAQKYNRQCNLTLEKLEACNALQDQTRLSATPRSKSKLSLAAIGRHFKGLFETKKIGLSTSLIWFSWLLIGLAYPLFNVFLPTYLETRGAKFNDGSAYVTWRNYTIVNACGIFGPLLAGAMCNSGWFWGRRGTMAIGALISMIFFFSYTQVRSQAQNLAFTSSISFCLNIYYATLYAYSPEVLPSAHRGTGDGIAIGLNRIMGILSAVIATVANTSTPVPIYICGALYFVMACVALIFPFEPYGARSS